MHAVHGVRRDLPGRDRARPDHQPDAPRPRRARRDGRPAAVDARDDLHVGQLVRRAEAQARTLGEGASSSRSRTRARSRSSISGSSATTPPSTRATSGNTQALARILHHAGVDFGILYDAEKTAGNDVRRVGEEGLYTSLAEENIEAIENCDFQRILTSDPHSYNTLRNEYPELGASWTADDVLHHSELLLSASSKTERSPPSKRLDYRVTYHDPCTLGRYNGVYEPPREVMKRLGIELVEMPRNRDNSFCCGAGGGRIWMKELKKEGAQRPSENRIDEAVALGRIEYFIVACPKDVTMYEDAIKTSGHAAEIELRELSELVLEALELEPVGVASAAAAPDDAESADDR